MIPWYFQLAILFGCGMLIALPDLMLRGLIWLAELFWKPPRMWH